MRTIKVFLASSEELENDCNAFGNLVRKLDKIYDNIGVVYDDKGDYDRALEYYLKAYNIFKQKLGAVHPYTKMAEENIELVKSKMDGKRKKGFFHRLFG